MLRTRFFMPSLIRYAVEKVCTGQAQMGSNPVLSKHIQSSQSSAGKLRGFSRSSGTVLVSAAASFAALIPSHVLARQVHAEAAISEDLIKKEDMRITLYQYDVCPFCNKVRAYLDYHNVPYSVVEVDPSSKKELQDFSSDYRKVPIAVVNDVQVNGSGSIITHVRGAIQGDLMLAPDATRRDNEWLTWVDDVLIHLISPNIYRSITESLQAFEYITENAKFSSFQKLYVRHSGALAMYFVAKKIKTRHNIEKPREEMYAAIQKWTAAVDAEGGKFLAGGAPGAADLAVFGVLRAIQNFDTFGDIKDNCPDFEAWFERTQKAVGENAIVERM